MWELVSSSYTPCLQSELLLCSLGRQTVRILDLGEVVRLRQLVAVNEQWICFEAFSFTIAPIT